MPSPARILRQREVTAMAALDTMPHLAARVRNLLTHGRRMTVTQRYTYVDQPPEVTAGLTLDAEARGGGVVEGVKPGEHHHFGVYLRPGLLSGFGFSAYASDGNTTEADVWKRYHDGKDATEVWKQRRNMTLVEIVGGLPGDGPARDDRLVIRSWNDDAVCDERVIAFDYGPDREQQRDDLARHLWVADAGSPDRWDSFTLDDNARAPFYTRADELLAVIGGQD